MGPSEETHPNNLEGDNGFMGYGGMERKEVMEALDYDTFGDERRERGEQWRRD